MTEQIPEAPQPTPEPAQYGKTIPAVAGREMPIVEQVDKYVAAGGMSPEKATDIKVKVGEGEANRKSKERIAELRNKAYEAQNAINKARNALASAKFSKEMKDDYINKIDKFTDNLLQYQKGLDAATLNNYIFREGDADYSTYTNGIDAIKNELNNLQQASSQSGTVVAKVKKTEAKKGNVIAGTSTVSDPFAELTKRAKAGDIKAQNYLTSKGKTW
jgi:hypothetical protein